MDIKKLLDSDKLIIGTNRTLKALKSGTLKELAVSSNCDKTTLKNIEYYTSLAGLSIEKLSMPNDELGVICRKPFSVSVIGVLK